MPYQSFGTVAERAGFGTTTANWSFSRAVPAGRQLVLWAFGEDGQAGSVAHVSDPRGNTWVALPTTGSAASIAPSTKIYACHVVTPYQVGDSITVNFFGSFIIPHVGLVREYSGLDVASLAGSGGRSSGTSYSLGPVTPAAGVVAVGGINAMSLSGPPSVGVNAPFSVLTEGASIDPAAFEDLYAKAVEWEPTTNTATSLSGSLSPSSSWAGTWASINLLPQEYRLDQHRDPSTRLFVLRTDVNTGALYLDRYDDAFPEVLADTITLETSGVLAGSVVRLRAGRLAVVYTQGTDAKYRSSDDSGGTWSVATTIASSVDSSDAWFAEDLGLLVVAAYGDSLDRWNFYTVEVDSAGALTVTGGPFLLTNSARAGGRIFRDGNGIWRFVYTTTAGVVAALRCRDLDPVAGGTFS